MVKLLINPAFLGKVPGLENVFEIVAHTGRGVMISYAAGEALTDLIIDGKFRGRTEKCIRFFKAETQWPTI